MRLRPVVFVSILSISSIGSISACQSGGFTDSTVTEIDGICAEAAPGGVKFTVSFATCTSSSCDTVRDSGCEVMADGTNLVVSGEAVIRTKTGPFQACTDDCGFVTAVCTFELDLGSYTVSAGSESLDFEIPVVDGVCTGNGFLP